MKNPTSFQFSCFIVQCIFTDINIISTHSRHVLYSTFMLQTLQKCLHSTYFLFVFVSIKQSFCMIVNTASVNTLTQTYLRHRITSSDRTNWVPIVCYGTVFCCTGEVCINSTGRRIGIVVEAAVCVK